MKKYLFVLMLGFTLNSCMVSSEVAAYPTTQYASTEIMYYHTYYYNGTYCPVLYVETIPYYFYRNAWYVVPTYSYKYIRYYNYGMPLRHTPPRNYVHHHRHHPPHHHRPTPHTHSNKPNVGRPSTPPNRPSGNVGRPSTPPNRPSGNVGRPSTPPNRPSGNVGRPSTPPNRPSGNVGRPTASHSRPSGHTGGNRPTSGSRGNYYHRR